LLSGAQIYRRFEGGVSWTLGTLVIVLAVMAPLLSLAVYGLQGSFEHWGHLFESVIPDAAVNTLILLAGVGVLVTCLGTGAAWLVSAYEFPTRGWLNWALLLPLAVPTYIIAFAYLDLWHPIGPIQTILRDVLGYSSPRDLRLPDVRSITGAIFLLGFVLYPYVYLSTRFMFITQAAGMIEAARILGETPYRVVTRVALPLARPAIAVGVSLALLETLNDIGASEFLGVQTMTVAVYTTWVTRSDLAGAAQIALSMLLIVVFLIQMERRARQRQRYSTVQRMRPMQLMVLKGWHKWLAVTLGWIPVVIGFIAPAGYLAAQAYTRLDSSGSISSQLTAAAVNTLTVSAVATVLTIALGLVVGWSARRVRESSQKLSLAQWLAKVASLGYAVPGTVLAIGLLAPLLLIDNSIEWVAGLFGIQITQLLVMGSVAGLLIAYSIRFLAIAVGSIEAGLSRIPPSIEQASRLLGHTPAQTLKTIHLPLLRPALAAAALLIFVDTMKELPATLLLRPLNFDTLATWLYAEASRGTYEEGAVAALLIVLVGLIPVILLARTQSRPLLSS
jgi:iron(III) transport system permease protein